MNYINNLVVIVVRRCIINSIFNKGSKMKSLIVNQKGNSILVVIFVIILVIVIGYVGWNVYDARTNRSADIQTNQSTVTGNAAPTALYNSEKNNFCLADKAGLFTEVDDESYTYKNESLGLEFVYPEQWGSVILDESNNPMCVGPLVFGVGKAGEFGQGDDPLTSTSHGYYKEDDKYYRNWFKNSENGPYEIEHSYDIFKEIATANGSAILLANNCMDDIGCSIVAMVNLNSHAFPGMGVRTNRAMKEQKDSNNPFAQSHTFEQLVTEIETFLKTVRVN
jgi:hypothetical protein